MRFAAQFVEPFFKFNVFYQRFDIVHSNVPIVSILSIYNNHE